MESATKDSMQRPDTAQSDDLLDKLQVVFVIGAPGAGKGTLCKRLTKEVSCYHLSVGDYLRDLRASTDDLSVEALGGLSLNDLKAKLDARESLDAEPMVAILRRKLEQEAANGHTIVIIDGFPRTLDSAKLFDAQICQPTMVLLFDCPRELAERRFLNRRRENGDDGDIFAKRYAKFARNNPQIVSRYASKLKNVSTSGDDLLASYPNLTQYFSKSDSRTDFYDLRQ